MTEEGKSCLLKGAVIDRVATVVWEEAGAIQTIIRRGKEPEPEYYKTLDKDATLLVDKVEEAVSTCQLPGHIRRTALEIKDAVRTKDMLLIQDRVDQLRWIELKE